jgi:hypothetical protein
VHLSTISKTNTKLPVLEKLICRVLTNMNMSAKFTVRFEVSTAVTVKNTIFLDISGPLVKADVSEELTASIIKAERFSELGTLLAPMFPQNFGSYKSHMASYHRKRHSS